MNYSFQKRYWYRNINGGNIYMHHYYIILLFISILCLATTLPIPYIGEPLWILDAKTAIVLIEGKKEIIRLPGINTPSSDQLGYGESLNLFEESLNTDYFSISSHVYNCNNYRDEHGYLLSDICIYKNDPKLVSNLMISNGYAFVSDDEYVPCYKESMGELIKLQIIAIGNRKGIWTTTIKDNGKHEKSIRPNGIHKAVQQSDISKTRELISNQINIIDSKDQKNYTALCYAIEKQFVDIADVLLNNGANPNVQCGNKKRPPLTIAVILKNEKLINLLISKNAIIDLQDVEGWNSFHFALLGNQSSIIKLLLLKGVDINKQNNYGQTPLHIAAENNKLEYCLTLLDHGADPNINDNVGLSPLHTAILGNNIKIVDLLLKKGANISIANNGMGPLHCASLIGNTEIARLLISKGDKINSKSSMGRTPLGYAVYENRVDMVAYLIKKGARINVKDSKGNYPIHLAVLGMPKDNEILKLLIENGAKVKSKNKDGLTPLEIAKKDQNLNAISFLEKYASQ